MFLQAIEDAYAHTGFVISPKRNRSAFLGNGRCRIGHNSLPVSSQAQYKVYFMVLMEFHGL